MIKEEGYIVLDKYNCNSIIKNKKTKREVYFFNIDDIDYVFKPTEYRYNELFASICAKEIGIDALEYDLAIYKGKKGVISKNYKKDGAKYISGKEILNNFYSDNKKFLKDLDSSINIYKTNNLEHIWLALEYYYKDYKNNIPDIMNSIVDLYMFSLLINDSDKHYSNWEVEEYNNNIKLVPIYDNERAFMFGDESLSLNVSSDNFYENPYDSSLKTFLSISDKYYVDRFINFYNILYSDGQFDNIISKIESLTKTKIPCEIITKLETIYYGIKLCLMQKLDELNIISNKKLN